MNQGRTRTSRGDQDPFSVAGPVFLRMPTLPHHHADKLANERDPAEGDEREALTRILCTVAADPLVREALEVSSDSLAGVLRRVRDGENVRMRQLRRATYAACRYLMRMTSRPTPFGLMAGVAVGSFDDDAVVELGAAHRKGVRPDGEWLAALLTEWESRRDIVRGLRVCANDLHFERAGRLVLPYVPLREPTGTPADEKSVRATPPARIAMANASIPIAFTDLVEQLVGHYPQAGTDRVEQLLMELIEVGLLCTELSPPPHHTDPVAYVLGVLAHTPAPETVELRTVAALFDDYAAAPLGDGQQHWAAARAQAHKLRGTTGSPVQVDLRVDAHLTLPRIVAREAESAAATLLRLSPASGSPPHLAHYHYEFLDKYGAGNAVPVKEVLDPQRGLGPPAGYRLPGNSRFSESAPQRDAPRNRKLGELATDALLSGSGEVVLDEATIAELAPDTVPAPAPDTAELNFQLLAESVAAMERGDFHLVSSPAMGLLAGGVFGRFAYLFEDSTALRDVMPAPSDDPLRAQLAFHPAGGRQSNVMRVPTVTERTLAIGVFDERASEHVLSLDDVGIIADSAGLTLVSLRDQRRLTALSPQMLETVNRTPNAARLCREISASQTRTLRTWQWGELEYLPYLPRVRYGRTVLAQARWRPPAELIEASANPSTWDGALDRWRERVHVPDVVQARHADHSVELDLNAPLHRRLLADEIRRKPELIIAETAHDRESDFDWLSGHANEIVVPLRSLRSTVEHSTTHESWLSATGRRDVPPGGEWVFAKLYSGAELHQEILSEHLPRLLDNLESTVDVWFFLRYADPDEHLRVRFHGQPETLNQTVLPQLHSWARELHEGGLLRKLELDSYQPEVDRYGGPEVIEMAERAFRADSEAVLAQLPLCAAHEENPPAEVLAAVNFVDLLLQMEPDWTTWYAHVDIQHYADMPQHVREAVRLIDALLDESRPESDNVVTTIRAACEHRSPALGEYARAVGTCDASTSDRYRSVVSSVLHMHHNRLLGGNQESEARAHAVASRVAATYHGRAKAPRA